MTENSPYIPQNTAAEESVIGSILINPDTYLDVALFLRADDFFIHRNRWIWEAISRLYENSTPVDFLTVIEELQRKSHLEDIGGPAYLAALINNTPTSLHAEAYGHIVEQAAIRRRILAAASKVAGMICQEDTALETVIEQAKKTLFAATERINIPEILSINHVLRVMVNQLEQDTLRKEMLGVRTGFSNLDRLLLGMQPSDLIIVAGRPGIGKTSLLLSIVKNAIQNDQKHVAFFTLEMSSNQLAHRLVAMQIGIDTQRIRSGNLENNQRLLLTQAVEELAGTHLFLSDVPTTSPIQVAGICRHLHQDIGLDLIVVDYLQLMSGGGSFENRTQEISQISRQLKSLARELNVPVLVAAQLSRAIEQRVDKHPILSDLRESGSIEQDADVVLFLYRADPGKTTKWTDVIVAKDRNGPLGTVRLEFQPEITKFLNPQE